MGFIGYRRFWSGTGQCRILDGALYTSLPSKEEGKPVLPCHAEIDMLRPNRYSVAEQVVADAANPALPSELQQRRHAQGRAHARSSHG